MDKSYHPPPSAISPYTNENRPSSSKINTSFVPMDDRRLKKKVDKSTVQEPNSGCAKSPVYRILSPGGDIILQYENVLSSELSRVCHQWKVSSEKLMQNSRYFAVLLAPDKFSEGHFLSKEKHRLRQISQATGGSLYVADEGAVTQLTSEGGGSPQLPIVNFKVDRPLGKQKIEIIEIFLTCLCHNSPDRQEKPYAEFHETLRSSSVSIIAALLDLADHFNSLDAVLAELKASGYNISKNRKLLLTSFSPSLLKLSEEKLRQLIYIARLIGDGLIFRVLTHTMILTGSSSRIHGIGVPDRQTLQWSYLPGGIEEELYYRRQSVLNTITDLQAYFLRLYGGMNDGYEVRPPSSPVSTWEPPLNGSSTNKDRLFQCRSGFTNSKACDAFHLGQMLRFLTVRTKTIFIGSTLIDPEFELEEDEANNNTLSGTSSNMPGDIPHIIASLRQIPDYQIDGNHVGCGTRRRILPALDCIERFTGDSDALLGLELPLWDLNPGRDHPASNDIMTSWRNKRLERANSVDIRHSKIISIDAPLLTTLSHRLANNVEILTKYRESRRMRSEDARWFFTTRRRNWEA